MAPPCPQILGQRVCPIGLAEAPPVSPEGTQDTYHPQSSSASLSQPPRMPPYVPPLPAFAGHAVTPGASTSPFHRLEDRFPEDRGAEAQRAHCGLEGTARLRCLCPRHTHTLTPFSHTRTHTFDHTIPPAQVLGAIDVTPSGLSTSLTYIVPTCQRLFTLETCCGYGYGPARDLHPLPRIFKGQRELTGRRRNRDAFQGTGPSLGANPFQGALPFTKKRELSPGLPPASPGSVALPHWTPRGAHLRHSGFGDLNPTPFRSAEGNGGHRPSLRNGARPSLRTD